MGRATGEPESDNLLVAKPQSHSYIAVTWERRQSLKKYPLVSLPGDTGGGSVVIPCLCGRQRPGSEGFGLLGTLSCSLSGPHVVFCASRHQKELQQCDLSSRHAVGSRVRKPHMLDFPGEMDLPEKALLSLSSGAQPRRKGEGKVVKEALQPSPLPWLPLAPEAQQSQALASLSWSSRVEIHNWETSVPKAASERPHSPILLESTEPHADITNSSHIYHP